MVAAELKTLGSPVDNITPGSAITGLLRQSAGLVAALTIELEARGGLDSEQARGSLAVFNSERDRLARLAKIASDIGGEERAIKLAEAHTRMLSDFIQGVASRLDLPPEQRKALGPAIREEAATLNGEGREVE